MRRTMREGDGVAVTLHGQTHTFGPDRMRASVDQTTARDGTKYRFATIVIQLDDEFPEDLTNHLTRFAEG